jgi:hypothetical protein
MTYVIDRQHKQNLNQLHGLHIKFELRRQTVDNVSLILEQEFLIKSLIPLESRFNKIIFCIVNSKF